MVRSRRRVTLLVVAAVFVVSLDCFALPGRLVDRLKSRIDERVIRRFRVRGGGGLNALGFAPTPVGVRDNFGDPNALGANKSNSSNVTVIDHLHDEGELPNVEDYPEMVISESDLTDDVAALGEHRIQFFNKIFEQNVIFRFYHGNNLTKTTTLAKTHLLADTGCNMTGKFSIIVHGWRENCYETFWVPVLERNLNTHRGGCVICMDYSTFSSNTYPYLLRRFNELSAVLLKFLRTLQHEGLLFENLFMFGFSFGGQLVLDAGNQVGFSAIEAIDTCDMAGVGFDSERFFRNSNFRNAAKNVQCIHTSVDKGTKLTDKCHQDWRMGQCGLRQPAAGKPPFGSHGLCPVYYNLAFDYDFYAEPRPQECGMLRASLANYPKNYRMGYMENRKDKVRGELFAPTLDRFPYAMNNTL